MITVFQRANQHRRERSSSGPLSDVLSVFFLATGLLYFLALASYIAYDLPAWVPFSPTTEANSPVNNFIGPVGAILAGYSFFILGVASYLLPTCLIWFGVSKLLSGMRINRQLLLGFALILFSSTCLLQYQRAFFVGWRESYMSLGPGGGFGYLIGEKLMVNSLGLVGSTLIMSAVYFCGLVLLAGMKPVDFLLFAWDVCVELGWIVLEKLGWSGHSEELAEKAQGAAALASATVKKGKKALPSATPGVAATAQSKKTQASKVKKKEEGTALPLLPLEFEERPAPKIIDAASPRAELSAVKKPTLEELKADLDKKKAAKKGAATKVTGSSRATLGKIKDLGAVFEGYELPPIDLLHYDPSKGPAPTDRNSLLETQNIIVRTLSSFGIEVSPGDITHGPTITRYEIYPSEGLRVNRIVALEADLARATKAESINIIAPIPGRDTVGIEIANDKRAAVSLRELLADEAFKKGGAKIPLALGKDVYGKTIIGDLAAMPHLLISGATGAGKSVCINSIIASLLYQFKPDELRFIMVDPKVVEMQPYKNLPHLAIPLVTEPKKVLLALRWVLKEMEGRYQMFKKVGCRDFESFNSRELEDQESVALPGAGSSGDRRASAKKSEATDLALAVKLEEGVSTPGASGQQSAGKGAEAEKLPNKLPYIVVVIDELADLMDTAPADVELGIVRIAQMARASGIHLILATQTPRAEVITGRIRANIPSKIAFRVSSALESRVILETKGAEKLVGKGDMLYLPPGSSQELRAQGALVTDEEIKDLVSYVSTQADPVFEKDITETIEKEMSDEEEGISQEDEELVEKCIEILRQEQKASTSMLQRRLRLGYNRASRMMDILELRGIVGAGDGAKPREILVDFGNEVV